MFGFPTRARLLYHKQPRNWPPRQSVDRDLELAVSMFAPGAETVKERTIHTAIGVGHYIRQGHSGRPGSQILWDLAVVDWAVRQLPARGDGQSE